MTIHTTTYRSIYDRDRKKNYVALSRTGTATVGKGFVRLLAALALLAFLSIAFSFWVSDASGVSPKPAGAGEKTIIVAPGDTLWSIALAHPDGNGDIQRRIYELKKRNGLDSSNIVPGMSLIVPDLR